MTPRLLQLYAIRSQIEALILAEEVDESAQGAVQCPHPEDKRRPTHNMGQEPEFLCLECLQTVKGTV